MSNKKMIVRMSIKELEDRLGVKGTISGVNMNLGINDNIDFLISDDGFNLESNAHIPIIKTKNRFCLLTYEALK